jgi:hypothetical protein
LRFAPLIGYNAGMPTFSLRRLLVFTALLAIGFALVSLRRRPEYDPLQLIWGSSAIAMAIGLFCFRRALVGVAVGFFVGFILAALFFVLTDIFRGDLPVWLRDWLLDLRS